ncbi:MAG: hypothetical protein IT314_16865 [Anaerolineales bacterium]|nr:hypothetical protein [Anaerolineales bacterium]
MALHLHGIIRGKQIELERETGIPSGSLVEPGGLSLDEKRRLVDALCGVWASDNSIKTLFSEIEKSRAVMN